MIQQIYITDYLSDAATDTADVIQRLIKDFPILLNADWEVSAGSPSACLFGALQLADKLAHATSIIPAILRERQTWDEKPSLCLLPVHMGLQRDTFSLQGTLQLSAEVYGFLTDRLQQHFGQDFILHPAPEKRFWWVQPLNHLDVQSSWPQDCLYQQAFQWQPQGKHASLIRQWTNESQMLLHQISGANNQPALPSRLNSLWFASVPELPVWQQHSPTVYGSGAVFEGLQACGLPSLKQLSLAESLGESTIKQAVMVVDSVDEVDWDLLNAGISKGRLSSLEIILPLAERSVRITYKRNYRWQFWRKAYTMSGLLAHLEAALPTTKLPETI